MGSLAYVESSADTRADAFRRVLPSGAATDTLIDEMTPVMKDAAARKWDVYSAYWTELGDLDRKYKGDPTWTAKTLDLAKAYMNRIGDIRHEFSRKESRLAALASYPVESINDIIYPVFAFDE